ncbi:MAG: DUF6308 family protein [Mycetocola sp.]
MNDIRRHISEVISHPAADLVAAYFAPGPFAGATFDGLGENDPRAFSPDDLVAVSLLDVTFEPRAVRSLLETDRDEFSRLLDRVDANVPLWAADDALLDNASELYLRLKQLPGVKRTKTSKLMARKRAHLVPIVDSVIIRELALGDEVWRPLRTALEDADLRGQIDALRPAQFSEEQISTLRLLDVAAWMRGSESENARAARRKVGQS